MTTISAGATAGLLVALLVLSTSEGLGADPLSASDDLDTAQPSAAKGSDASGHVARSRPSKQFGADR